MSVCFEVDFEESRCGDTLIIEEVNRLLFIAKIDINALRAVGYS